VNLWEWAEGLFDLLAWFAHDWRRWLVLLTVGGGCGLLALRAALS
jgi:hypothetical protein